MRLLNKRSKFENNSGGNTKFCFNVHNIGRHVYVTAGMDRKTHKAINACSCGRICKD